MHVGKAMDRFLPQVEWASALTQTGREALDAEFQAERASALGAAGKRLEQALTALAQAAPDEHPAQLQAARQRCWEFMVQRETLGLRDWSEVVRLYAIPPEVLQDMGAVPARSRAGP